MVGLLVVFGQIADNPRDGKNSGLVQSLMTDPYSIQLAGGTLLSVPWSIARQRDTRAVLDWVDKLQHARFCHARLERVRTDDAFPFAALFLPKPIEGIGVADGNFHRPADSILAQDVLEAQGEIGIGKDFDRWG